MFPRSFLTIIYLLSTWNHLIRIRSGRIAVGWL